MKLFYFICLKDILHTIIGLPNIVHGMNHEVEFELFTHLDFLWGIDADKYVYSHMLDNLQTCRDRDCRNIRQKTGEQEGRSNLETEYVEQ